MSALHEKKIAIVGGGPGGLTLARLLQLRGAQVTVYERDLDRNARLAGSALDLHEESGLAALAEAGLMEGFWARFRPELDRLRLVTQRGEILYDFMRGEQHGVRRPEIERAPLRDLLLDSLEPGTVRWNKKLDAATVDGHQIRLRFADGEEVSADLVVGADGANSRLRSLVTETKPSYVGVTLYEGSVPDAKDAVPEIWELVGGSALIVLGDEQTLAMATKSDGSLLFYAGLQVPDLNAARVEGMAADPKARMEWFRENFPTWDQMWWTLLERTTVFIPRPLYVCPVDQQWDAQQCVTLIGDAAHVMPPYAGEGVNMAMLDALVLARELSRATDIRTAITTYQAEMFSRTGAIASMTMDNTEKFYAPDASDRVVRMFQQFATQSAVRVSDAIPQPEQI